MDLQKNTGTKSLSEVGSAEWAGGGGHGKRGGGGGYGKGYEMGVWEGCPTIVERN